MRRVQLLAIRSEEPRTRSLVPLLSEPVHSFTFVVLKKKPQRYQIPLYHISDLQEELKVALDVVSRHIAVRDAQFNRCRMSLSHKWRGSTTQLERNLLQMVKQSPTSGLDGIIHPKKERKKRINHTGGVCVRLYHLSLVIILIQSPTPMNGGKITWKGKWIDWWKSRKRLKGDGQGEKAERRKGWQFGSWFETTGN